MSLFYGFMEKALLVATVGLLFTECSVAASVKSHPSSTPPRTAPPFAEGGVSRRNSTLNYRLTVHTCAIPKHVHVSSTLESSLV